MKIKLIPKILVLAVSVTLIAKLICLDSDVYATDEAAQNAKMSNTNKPVVVTGTTTAVTTETTLAETTRATTIEVITREEIEQATATTYEEKPFTPEGNLSLVDDVTVEEENQQKQFITAVSKNGNYFYIIVDRDGDKNNVHLLNLVDEADLLALIEEPEEEKEEPVCICDEKCEIGSINTKCPVCIVNKDDCKGKVIETTAPQTEAIPAITKKSETKKSPYPALIIVLLLGVGGYFYYTKIFKKKKENAEQNVDDVSELDYFEEDYADDYSDEQEQTQTQMNSSFDEFDENDI